MIYIRKKQNLKDKAYNFIRGKIIRCEYRPGMFLNEATLKEEIGASRTPIREALNKLEQEGLLVILPKRGVMVQDITLAEINAIFEIRFMIEPYVISKYGHIVSHNELAEMCRRVAACSPSMSKLAIYEVDSDLHKMFVCACGNPYIIDLMKKIFGQNQRLKILSGESLAHRLQHVKEEHETILRYMKKKNFAKAAEAMWNHLEESREASLQVLSGNIDWKG